VTEEKPERTETDVKLRVERERSNDELLTRSSAADADADAVVRRARERAAAVLELARSRQDESSVGDPELLRAERARADATLDLEYAAADARLGNERARRLRAVIQLLATERDETDHALATERVATDRMLSTRDDVLAGVSHDIRSHLNMLLLNASCIVAMRPDDHEVVKLADRMLRSAAQMDNLVADLLDVASMDRGPLRIQPTRQDIVALARTVIELHEPAARARSIDIVFSAATTPIELEVDAPRISRALLNLLGNAIKFTPEHGRVTVTIRRVGEEVELAVADTGPGISPDQLEAIFERFRRADTGSQKAGYGLGLYIARTIVNAHRGRIWAENNVNEGATFHIHLPITDGRSAASVH
jgi:signal transduction histidine kinase